MADDLHAASHEIAGATRQGVSVGLHSTPLGIPLARPLTAQSAVLARMFQG